MKIVNIESHGKVISKDYMIRLVVAASKFVSCPGPLTLKLTKLEKTTYAL